MLNKKKADIKVQCYVCGRMICGGSLSKHQQGSTCIPPEEQLVLAIRRENSKKEKKTCVHCGKQFSKFTVDKHQRVCLELQEREKNKDNDSYAQVSCPVCNQSICKRMLKKHQTGPNCKIKRNKLL